MHHTAYEKHHTIFRTSKFLILVRARALIPIVLSMYLCWESSNIGVTDMTLVKPLNQQMPDICTNKIRNTPDRTDMYRYISDLSVLTSDVGLGEGRLWRGGWWTCGLGRFWYWVNLLFRRCGHRLCKVGYGLSF